MKKRSMIESSRGEDGASLVVVILSLFVLLGAGALAVDAGSLWMTKRNFVADTDAAALAGAMHAAEAGCDTALAEAEVEAEAQSYLAANQGGAVSGTPDVTVDCDEDTVTVDYTGQAPMTFAGALGFSQLDVFSSSTAEFDFDPEGQLRPMATCIGNPMVEVAGAAGWDTPALITTFENGNTSELSACGSQPGNWGWLCLDSKCGNKDADPKCSDPDGFRAFVRCGYDPGLQVGAAPIDGSPPLYAPPYDEQDEDCYAEGGPSDWCETKTGALSGSMTGAFDAALEQRVFPIILTDRFDSKPGQTTVHPKALLWVRMDGYCIAPNNTRQWPDDPWGPVEKQACAGKATAFKMAPLFVQWSDGDVLPDFILQRLPAHVRLCGVDHDPAGGNRC